MLDAFIVENRDEIIRRCRLKVEKRATSTAPAELIDAIPQFLDHLVDALRRAPSSNHEIGKSAAQHGRDRHLKGFTVSQVVHDYGDVCQSITELALQEDTSITVNDFRTLNACLDDAIASAVTEHGRGNQSLVDAESARVGERLGFLEHELRNLVGTATVAFEVLKIGNVGVGGSTGAVLQRSLSSLRDLINRSIAEIRLRHDLRNHTRFDVADFIAEIASTASLDASARGLAFHVQRGDAGVIIEADRSVLTTVIMNLLQNAFKFTRAGTSVSLRSSATSDRVLIEVEDECGGLPDGNIADLFQAFEQRGVDRTGLGLGLAISRRGVEVNNGRIHACDLPGHGCVFTVDLPRVATTLVAS